MFVARQRDCNECRERFTWIDGTPVNEQFPAWQGSEPGGGDKCIRMTDRVDFAQLPLWAGSPCTEEINYACSRGF